MSGDDGHEGPLAEFAALRQEIDDFRRAQFQILALQLTITGAVFGFVLSVANISALLLVLPVSSYLLCARYVAQHLGTLIDALYIREELSPRVPGGLGWEAWRHGPAASRLGLPPRRRLWLSTIPLLLGFPGSATLALAWSFASLFPPLNGPLTASTAGLAVVWMIGIVATVASSWLLILMGRREVLTLDSDSSQS
jgi:hypothetical protein